MNISMQVVIVVAAVCLCLVDGAPQGRMTRKQQRPTRGFKNVEMMTARGFGKRDRPSIRTEHNYEAPHRRFNPKARLMVAPDFGKRSGNDGITDEGRLLTEEEIRVTRGTFKPYSNILIARGYGKRDETQESGRVFGLDNIWDSFENTPEKDNQEIDEDKVIESIPLDWFVNEMMNNPDFARSVVRKFIDLNQDGALTSDELLRNVA